MLLPPQSSRNPVRSLRTRSASSGGSKSLASCAAATGSPAVSSAASRMPLMSFKSSMNEYVSSFEHEARTGGQLHINRSVGLGLRDGDQPLARGAEEREKRPHEMWHVGMGREQRGELGITRRRQDFEHPAHLGAHRKL